MADGREQRAPQFVGLLDGLGLAGLVGQFTLPFQTDRLFRDGIQDAPISRGQSAPGHQQPELVVADFDCSVSGIDCRAGMVANTATICSSLRPRTRSTLTARWE